MKCKNLATGQVVLIRAYGKNSELIIDRQAELLVSVHSVYNEYNPLFIFSPLLDVLGFTGEWISPTSSRPFQQRFHLRLRPRNPLKTFPVILSLLLPTCRA